MSLNWRFACKRPVVACYQLVKGSRIKQREKFNCTAVTTEAWAALRRSSGLKWPFRVALCGGTEPIQAPTVNQALC